ncbi:MAG: SDR family NAD(P)-dependent oxidoreductase, partial [Mycobacterium sp.]
MQRLLEFAAGLLVHPPDMLRHVHIGGKTALLTGATGGLGRVIAKALAARGATLVLSSRKADELNELAGSLGGSGHT